MVYPIKQIEQIFGNVTACTSMLFMEPGRDLYISQVGQIHTFEHLNSGAGMMGNDYMIAAKRLDDLPKTPLHGEIAHERAHLKERVRILGKRIKEPLEVALSYTTCGGFYEWVNQEPHNHSTHGMVPVTFGIIQVQDGKRVFTPRSDLTVLIGSEATLKAREFYVERNNGKEKFFRDLFPRAS